MTIFVHLSILFWFDSKILVALIVNLIREACLLRSLFLLLPSEYFMETFPATTLPGNDKLLLQDLPQ